MTTITLDPNAPPAPFLVSRSFVAKTLNVPYATVAKWSQEGAMPRERKVGGRLFFVKAEIEAFLERIAAGETGAAIAGGE